MIWDAVFEGKFRPILLLGLLLTQAGCITSPEREIHENHAPMQAGGKSACAISKVVDGDTVKLRCPQGSVNARLVGFDTPETYRAGCNAEKRLGGQATRFLENHLAQATRIEIELIKARDKYGRVLLKLFVDGRDVRDTMISEGLAVRYSGGRRISWCERLLA